MKVRTRRPRKLLSASLGVAAVSYVACGGSSSTVANLVAPPTVDGAAGHPGTGGAGGCAGTVGNLVPPPPVDGGTGGDPFDVVANLVVAPVDAGPDQVNDAPSDATDATRDSPPSFFDVVANLVVDRSRIPGVAHSVPIFDLPITRAARFVVSPITM